MTDKIAIVIHDLLDKNIKVEDLKYLRKEELYKIIDCLLTNVGLLEDKIDETIGELNEI